MISILIPCKNGAEDPNISNMMITAEEAFPLAQIVVAADRYGNGKGWALRQAMTEAKGDVIVFIDGDMDIHPRMIYRLLPFLDDYDIVVGQKAIKGLASRVILTHLSRFWIRILFGLKMDTQTGVKAFRRGAVPEWKTDGYMYDVEVLWKAKKWGARIIEVPVQVHITRGMKLKSVLNCFRETIRIWYSGIAERGQ